MLSVASRWMSAIGMPWHCWASSADEDPFLGRLAFRFQRHQTAFHSLLAFAAGFAVESLSGRSVTAPSPGPVSSRPSMRAAATDSGRTARASSRVTRQGGHPLA